MPNNDIWLQTEYQLFAKYYLVKPNIQLFGCNPDNNTFMKSKINRFRVTVE